MQIQQETQWRTRRKLTEAELLECMNRLGCVSTQAVVEDNGGVRCKPLCTQLSQVHVVGREGELFLVVLWWLAKPTPFGDNLPKRNFGGLLQPDTSYVEMADFH